MGNQSSSIQRLNFEDIQYANANTNKYIIINTLPISEQSCLIPNTIHFSNEESIINDSRETLSHLQEDSFKEPDIADRASAETDWSIELRTCDRQRKLIMKIDAAIKRIEEKDYGYCEVSGEQISLRRLQARPIATMTIESQEKHENHEKVHRDY